MRVAQVIGRLYAAGVEAVVNNYYRFTDVSQIQFDYFIDDNSVCAPSQEMKDRGARYFVVPSSAKPVRRVIALARIFRREKYPVVHAHMNALNMPVLLAAWLAGVPVRISHNHSTSDPAEGGRALIKQLLRPTGRWFATDYMACGEKAGRWLFGNRLCDEGRVSVLPNAVDVQRFRFSQEARARVRSEMDLGERLVVVHIGRFVKQKNHEFLLDIFTQVLKYRPDAVLLLVGEGKLRAQMEEKVRAAGITDSVYFLGIRKDVADLYCAADVFVLPSLYEGMPVVAWEAQASGLPCIFSDHVTREADALGSGVFLSLEADEQRWAQAVDRAVCGDRAAAADSLTGSRCDLRVAAKGLEKTYTEMTGRKG